MSCATSGASVWAVSGVDFFRVLARGFRSPPVVWSPDFLDRTAIVLSFQVARRGPRPRPSSVMVPVLRLDRSADRHPLPASRASSGFSAAVGVASTLSTLSRLTNVYGGQ